MVSDPYAELRRDVDYSRQRLDLYRAKVLSARPTTPARLRELEQAHERAAERLAHAVRTSDEKDSTCPNA